MRTTTENFRALTSRPVVADAVVALLVLGGALLPFAIGPQSEMLAVRPRWVLVGAAALGSASLMSRRRHPWSVYVLATTIGLVAVGVGGGPTSAYLPALVALFNVSSHKSVAQSVAAALLSGLAPVVVVLGGGGGAFDAVAFGVTAWAGIAVMSGIAVQNARAVVVAAHERARLAEANREEEAQRRVSEERLRIARELHDVMAHHVSVINVQAGVAGHLVRIDPAGASVAITHVREASQMVLREVSAMLGLLRSGDEGLPVAPAPRFCDVDVLVDSARRAGTDVVWQTTGQSCELTPSVDLTAYRVVQEALTNAARHGVGSVLVQVDYADAALTLGIRNRRADPAASDASPARHGLTGMRERADAVGGELVAGPDDVVGWWRVDARLPLERVAALPHEASSR